MPSLLPLVAALALGFAPHARAATIVVDDASPASVPGKCTISDAVAAINNAVAVEGCVAGDGNQDTIDLSGFVAPTTIAFTAPAGNFGHALVLQNAALIRGGLDTNGAPLVTLTRSSVSGTPEFGLIRTSAPLTLYGLTLSGGSTTQYLGGAVLSGDYLTVDHCTVQNNTSGAAGGGLASTNNLTLTDSIVSGNHAANAGGGVFSNKQVHIYYSTVSGNATDSSQGLGGGVYAMGAVMVRNSIVDGNSSAGKGGGIYAGAVATVVNTTISNNQAQSGTGGGIFATRFGVSLSGVTLDGNSASGAGGAVYSGAGDAVLENSTFSGNTAASGAAVLSQTIEMNYCTIAGNTVLGTGGAVEFTVGASSNGSIVYGNTPQDISTNGKMLDGSLNIVGQSDTLLPTDTLHCNPNLGPLADNGGLTRSMAIGSDSCALDAASAAPTENTDQRGFARPALGTGHFRADIGAFELQASEDHEIVFDSSFD